MAKPFFKFFQTVLIIEILDTKIFLLYIYMKSKSNIQDGGMHINSISMISFIRNDIKICKKILNVLNVVETYEVLFFCYFPPHLQ